MDGLSALGVVYVWPELKRVVYRDAAYEIDVSLLGLFVALADCTYFYCKTDLTTTHSAHQHFVVESALLLIRETVRLSVTNAITDILHVTKDINLLVLLELGTELIRRVTLIGSDPLFMMRQVVVAQARPVLMLIGALLCAFDVYFNDALKHDSVRSLLTRLHCMMWKTNFDDLDITTISMILIAVGDECPCPRCTERRSCMRIFNQFDSQLLRLAADMIKLDFKEVKLWASPYIQAIFNERDEYLTQFR